VTTPALERSRVRPAPVFAVVAVTLALYLGASLAWPARVPRLVVLPKPADRSFDEPCAPGRGGRVDERWTRTGLVWTWVRFNASGACAPAS
jgi:hypothetical protein